MKRWLVLVALVVTAGCAGSDGAPRGDSEGTSDSTHASNEVDAQPDGGADTRTAGLRIDLQVEEAGPQRERIFRLHVRDDDGGGPGYRLSYGDGRYDEVVLPSAACPPAPEQPPPPAALDKVIEHRHQYVRSGAYTVEVQVLSQRVCTGVADEVASLSEEVQVR